MMRSYDAKRSQRPILVTGAHRSGTTWVGKMLTADPHVAYISEPLNVLHRPGVMRAPVDRWYTYICEANEDFLLPALRETIRYRYFAWNEIHSLRSRKDLLRMGRDWSNFLGGRLFHKRPLLKDPFAVFSASWFADRLGCDVVIIVRHPAAVVSSLARLGWPFDFSDLLEQPCLMRDYLEPFRAEMEEILANPADVITRGSLLWRIIYSVIGYQVERHPDFIIVRHEDLALDPVNGYRSIYATLGLDFTFRVEQAILRASGAENPKESSQDSIFSVHRNSPATRDSWRQHLTPAQVAHIREMTADVADLYYPASSWED